MEVPHVDKGYILHCYVLVHNCVGLQRVLLRLVMVRWPIGVGVRIGHALVSVVIEGGVGSLAGRRRVEVHIAADGLPSGFGFLLVLDEQLV